MLRELANFSAGCITVHDRHLNIHEHAVKAGGPQYFQGLGSVVRHRDQNTFASQEELGQFLIQLIIFYKQYLGSLQIEKFLPWILRVYFFSRLSFFLILCLLFFRAGDKGQGEIKTGALIGSAFKPDRAAHHFHQLFTDCKT